MNLTIHIQTAHRVILGHEQVMPIERCERDCVPDAEIIEDRTDPQPDGHHGLCPWPFPTELHTDPPCVCDIIHAVADKAQRECRDEIVGLRADLIRATEALVTVGDECEQLRHVRLLADNLAADIKGARNTVQSWAELQEALDVLRGVAQ